MPAWLVAGLKQSVAATAATAKANLAEEIFTRGSLR